MSIHFDDVRRESEKTYFFTHCFHSGLLKQYLDSEGIDYECYASSQFSEVLPAGMEVPPVLQNPIPELGLIATAPYRFLRVFVSNLNTDDLMQKLIRILRGPDKPEDYRCCISDTLRDALNRDAFLEEITKDAVIPVAKSDVELSDELLSSQEEEEDEDDRLLDALFEKYEYDDEILPFAED